jgi:hypothetical protein
MKRFLSAPDSRLFDIWYFLFLMYFTVKILFQDVFSARKSYLSGSLNSFKHDLYVGKL